PVAGTVIQRRCRRCSICLPMVRFPCLAAADQHDVPSHVYRTRCHAKKPESQCLQTQTTENCPEKTGRSGSGTVRTWTQITEKGRHSRPFFRLRPWCYTKALDPCLNHHR